MLPYGCLQRKKNLSESVKRRKSRIDGIMEPRSNRKAFETLNVKLYSAPTLMVPGLEREFIS